MSVVLWPMALDPSAAQQLDGAELLLYDDPSAWPAGAEGAEVLVVGWGPVEPVADALVGLESLRLVQVLGAGVEQWAGRIPDGVLLSNARGAHGAATAEWALAALLAVVRDLPAFVASGAERRWDTHDTSTLVGADVVVVGAGDIGRELAVRLEANDSSVTLVGRSARPGVAGRDELPTLLPRAAAVVLAVPLDDSTAGMVDAGFLAAMADGAVLVNAARGPVVETDALVAELESGRLRAALDVTDPEPLPPDHPLWRVPGLLLTPHVAGSTVGATERAVRVAVDQVGQFLAGRVPDNVCGTADGSVWRS